MIISYTGSLLLQVLLELPETESDLRRSIDRSGISRLLPAFHRRMMMGGVDRAEKLVQLYFFHCFNCY